MTDCNLDRPRVLVLGSTGYIGRNILGAFAAADVVPIAGCRDARKLPTAFTTIPRRQGDLRDPHYRDAVFQGVDVACFASAWSALHGRARESRENFLEPTIAAMDAAARAGVKRILFTSAIDVNNVPRSRSRGIRDRLPSVWPHLANVMAIEDHLRGLARRGVATAAMRCGTFVGAGGSLGILPALIPRLRARLVPTIEGGAVPMRVIDGRDVGAAFRSVALASALEGFHGFDVAVEDGPSFLQMLQLLHAEFDIPLPWFSVSFAAAYRFAWFAETIAKAMPFDPLLTRSIVFLSEPAVVNHAPLRALGFHPAHRWQDSIRQQVAEIVEKKIPSRLTDGRAPRVSGLLGSAPP